MPNSEARISRDVRQRLRVGHLQGAINIGCTIAVECRYCRVWLPMALWTLDHIIPQVLGGRRRACENLVIACAMCNRIKAGNVICPKCGSLQTHRTYDRITWTDATVCFACGTITSCITRERPIGAPKHLRYGRHYRATGEILAFAGRV